MSGPEISLAELMKLESFDKKISIINLQIFHLLSGKHLTMTSNQSEITTHIYSKVIASQISGVPIQYLFLALELVTVSQ